MSTPVWGATDILVGHVVDCYGVMHRTWSGDLGGFMGNPSVQMGRYWLSGYEDPDFADRSEA
jgi:hypothetical protein